MNSSLINSLDNMASKGEDLNKFINDSFNQFLQFYNNKEYFSINKFKSPNQANGLNFATIFVKDKIKNIFEEFSNESEKMDLAILGAKEKFLRGTSLLIPPKLEQKIDNITDKFYSFADLDTIREIVVRSIDNSGAKEEEKDLEKFGCLYSNIFLKNKNHYKFSITVHKKKLEKNVFMTRLTITHKNKDIFESFAGIDKEIKLSKKKMYIEFLSKTKLPLPANLNKDKIQSIILNYNETNIDDLLKNKETYASDLLNNPSNGLIWDSENWSFEGFLINQSKKRPKNLASTVINVTECKIINENGSKDLYFKTFWKHHELPGVPKNHYDPLWVWAGDMLPNRKKREEDEPDCRKLVNECLNNQTNRIKQKCLKWLEENDYVLSESDNENENEERNKKLKSN